VLSKGCIKKRYGQDACNVGDEGGFAPSVQDNDEALDVLMDALQKSGHMDKVKIGLKMRKQLNGEMVPALTWGTRVEADDSTDSCGLEGTYLRLRAPAPQELQVD